MASVPRANSISFNYNDINGVMKHPELDLMETIIVQHEIDHLNGFTIHKHLSKLDCIRYSKISKDYKGAERKRNAQNKKSS
jgi:peptide deformylase